MTTESDFQAMLDADPFDWGTRLVLADWLEERGDKRAWGYRAMGLHGLRPRHMQNTRNCWTWWSLTHDYFPKGGDDLPAEWINHFPDVVGEDQDRLTIDGESTLWGRFWSRCEAEDVAAKAFALLPAESQLRYLGAFACVGGGGGD